MKRAIETTVLASLLLLGSQAALRAQTAPADHLLISEVGYDGKHETSNGSSEYVEIFNPTSQPVALDTVYLTDVTGDYIEITSSLNQTSANRLSVGSSDFIYRFPAGTVLRPGAVAVITQNADTFLADLFGGQLAAYEKTGGILFETKQNGSSNGVEDMVPIHSLVIASGSGVTKAKLNLSNAAELVVLFRWAGAQTALDGVVEDLDSVSWGSNTVLNGGTTYSNIVDKSNKQAPDGTSYSNDAGAGTKQANDIPKYSGSPSYNSSSALHPFSLQRQSAVETGETPSGGNGLTGHDESMEDWTQTFVYRDMDPGEAPLLGTAQVNVASTLSFGVVGIGTTETATLTISNTGKVALPIHTLTLTTATPSEFAIAGLTLPLAKPLIIGAGEQLILPVRFSPTFTTNGPPVQARNATLEIGFRWVEKDPASPNQKENLRHDDFETVAISGSAGQPPALAVTSAGQAAPATLSLGTVFLGQTGELEITIENQGTADLRITSFGVTPQGGAFSIDDSSSVTVTPNQPAVRRVRFSPRAAGQVDGTLTILSNDPQNPVKVFPLSGFGGELARAGGRGGSAGGSGCQLSSDGSPLSGLLWLGLLALVWVWRPGRREG